MAAEKNNDTRLAGDREIIATRIFNAPCSLVFEMWTDQNHIEQWWGPTGFTTTTYRHEVKPGGVWRFVMHGPDGRDYQNKITFVEVVAPERLVYRHGGDKDVESVNFEVVVTFEELGEKTRLTMQMIFPSAAVRDHVIEEYGAFEGLKETLSRLEAQIAAESALDRPFVISRTVDAPRDLVWRAWTERDRLMQWFGPKGCTITAARLDLRADGVFHYCMRFADGKEMWGKFVYREIVPPEKLVWVNQFSDEAGGLTRHPFNPDWPQHMLTMVTFAEDAGKTTITVQWQPIQPTAPELKTFNDNRSGMVMGWTGTFERLDEYLAKA